MSAEQPKPNSGPEKQEKSPETERVIDPVAAAQNRMTQAGRRVDEAEARAPGSAEKLMAEQKLKKICDVYEEKEGLAARTPVVETAKNARTINADTAYLPTLEALIHAVEDKDEWLRDSYAERDQEQELMINAATLTRKNIDALKNALDTAQPGPAKERLRQLYIRTSGRLTELLVNMDSSYYSVDIRDPDMGAKQAMDTISRMTSDEAIEWTKNRMAQIDQTNWQSRGLAQAYSKFGLACKQAIEVKLANEKAAAGSDPKKLEIYKAHCYEVAKLFSDNGTGIDNNLTNFDFADEMAREALDYEGLAIRYMEHKEGKGMEVRNTLALHVSHANKAFNNLMQAAGPQVAPKILASSEVSSMLRVLEKKPTSIAGMAEQYMVARMMQEFSAGLQKQLETGVPYVQPAKLQENIAAEFNLRMGAELEKACAEFDNFLKGDMLGDTTANQLNAVIGDPPLTPEQTQAFFMFRNVKGQRQLANLTFGAKIGATIVAGIAVGAVTAGAGFGVIAGSLAAGAGMTAITIVSEQRGVDSLEEATTEYGSELVKNVATAGAARYLAAGRAAYILNRAGALPKGRLVELLKIAGKSGGDKIINEIDDAGVIGARLMGATLEGAADTVVGASLDTALTGGTFLQNLEGNAMFMGLGYVEFTGPMLKKIQGLPDEKFYGLAGLVNRGTEAQEKLLHACKDANVTPKNVLDAQDLTVLLKDIDPQKAEGIKALVQEIADLKVEYEQIFEELGAATGAAIEGAGDTGGDTFSATTPQQRSDMKEIIMSLPEDERGRAMRVEAGEYVLGMEPGSMSGVQKQAIVEAHDVPATGVRENGERYYTSADLAKKMRILTAAGFTSGKEGQADALLRMGICGMKFDIPPPPTKKPSVSSQQKAADTQSDITPRTIKPPPAPVYVKKNVPAATPVVTPFTAGKAPSAQPPVAQRNIPPPPPPPPSALKKAAPVPAAAPSVPDTSATDALKQREQGVLDNLIRESKVLEQKAKSLTGTQKTDVYGDLGRLYQRIEKQKQRIAGIGNAPAVQPTTPAAQVRQAPPVAASQKSPSVAPAATPKKPDNAVLAPAAAPKKQDVPVQAPPPAPLVKPRQNPGLKNPDIQLSPEQLQAQQFIAQYGHLSPEQLDMQPEIRQKLQEYKKRGLFMVGHYYEGTGYETIEYARYNTDKMKYSTKDARRIQYDFYTKKENTTRASREGVDPQAREFLAIKPMTSREKIGTRKEMKQETVKGLFGEKIIEQEVDVDQTGEVPTRFADIVPGSPSTEVAVRLTYVATGPEYPSNVIRNRTSGTDAINPNEMFKTYSGGNGLSPQHDAGYQPNGTRQDIQNDIIKAQKLADYTNPTRNNGRADNYLAISVVLPESEAKALAKMFEAHPESMRAFFLDGGQEHMLIHTPPPYETWDRQQRPVVFRRFDAKGKPVDTTVAAQR